MLKEKNSTLGGDAVRLTSSKIITLIISMISAMLLSRFRTLREYGTYSQLLLIVNLVTSLLMLGLPNSINYFLARSETDKEKNRFLSTYYTLSTILSMLAGLLLVCSTPVIVSYFDNPLIASFIYFLAVYPWIKIVTASIENVLIVYKRISILIVYRVSNSILLIIIILIVQILNLTFYEYMLMFIAVESVFALSVYIVVKGFSSKFHVLFDIELIKKILRFSIPIGLASVVGNLNYNLDQLMIGKFYNTEQLAIYANAGKEMPVTIIATSLTAVLLPAMVRLLKKNEHEKAITLWGNSIELSYTVMCFFAASLFVFAPDVMNLLYSDKYLPGVPIFRVYTLVMLLRFTYFGLILNAFGKTKFILYSSIASLGLNILINYLFLKLFGFVGPAIATFVVMFSINFAQILATSKIIEIKLIHMFPWRKLFVLTSINICMGIAFYVLKYLLPLDMYLGSITESIVIGIFWFLLYFKILYKRIKLMWLSLNGGEK